MKTRHRHNQGHRRQGQEGMAVIVVLSLLVLILVFVGANLRALDLLGRELRQIERAQVRRLHSSAAALAAQPPEAPRATAPLPGPNP